MRSSDYDAVHHTYRLCIKRGSACLRNAQKANGILAATRRTHRITGVRMLQEACATVFEYFGAGYALPALEGVGTYFYATADVLPFGDDFAGGSQHPISDPSNTGSLCAQPLWRSTLIFGVKRCACCPPSVSPPEKRIVPLSSCN